MATIAAADVDDGSTDNCGAPNLSIDVSSFDCSNLGANTVTLTATDASGNFHRCTATVTVESGISIANVSTTNPKDCDIDNGSIIITTGASGNLEYSIDGGLDWQASDEFIGLSAGSYNVAVRYAGVSCFEPYPADPVTLTCAPYTGMYTNSSISGPNNVCDGNVFEYTFPYSIVPNGMLVEWIYTGSGTTTPISNPGEFDNLQIDFSGDVGSHQLLIEISDGTTTWRDEIEIQVLTQMQCALYDCLNGVHITAMQMDDGEVPSLVTMQQFITSDGHVDPFDEFTFQAGQTVELMPGFIADQGGVFIIKIEGCNPP
jgi:hypothetical protein